MKFLEGLIAFEGPDGSGKSTQAKLYSEYAKIPLTNEPWEDCQSGRDIRKHLRDRDLSPQEIQELFIQNRLEHLNQYLNPKIDQHGAIITDRYALSTIAYGCADNPENGRKLLRKQKELGVLFPETLVYIDVNPYTGMERIGKRQSTEEMFDKLERQKNIQTAYLNFMDLTCRNLVFINGHESIETVAAKIRKRMRKFYKPSNIPQ